MKGTLDTHLGNVLIDNNVIAEYAGNRGCDIHPCHSDEFPSPVRRPSYSVLDKAKIKDSYNMVVPYWMESLYNCLINIRNN